MKTKINLPFLRGLFFSPSALSEKRNPFSTPVTTIAVLLAVLFSVSYAMAAEKIIIKGKVIAYDGSIFRKTSITGRTLYLKVVKTSMQETAPYLKVQYKDIEENKILPKDFFLGKSVQELLLVRNKKCDQLGSSENSRDSLIKLNPREKIPRHETIPCYSMEAQSKKIRAFFEENGKDVFPKGVKIIVYPDKGTGVSLSVTHDYFIFPLVLQAYNKLSVKIVWSGHEMTFQSVDPRYFDNKWIIGFDNYPFERQHLWLTSQDSKKPLNYVTMSSTSIGGMTWSVQGN